jgi:hypothetical protein
MWSYISSYNHIEVAPSLSEIHPLNHVAHISLSENDEATFQCVAIMIGLRPPAGSREVLD